MWNDHARYREIELKPGYSSGSPPNEGPLKIVLFRRAAKLRSHAVKHLTNMSQLESTWRKMAPVDMGLVRQCISDLERAGCPYFALGTESPPCDDGRAGCRIFQKCPDSVRDLERAYLQAMVECIREGGEAPRYAYYFADNEQAHVFCLMPGMPLVLKASLLPGEEDVYNLMTCYAGEGISFTEMRDMQVEKIRNEARSRNTAMCSLSGWGLEDPASMDADSPRGGRKERRPKGKPRKHHGRGGRDWRGYLDNWDDWEQ